MVFTVINNRNLRFMIYEWMLKAGNFVEFLGRLINYTKNIFNIR